MMLSYKKPVSFVQIPLEAGVKGKLFASPMPFGPYDKMNRLLKAYVRGRIDCVVILTTMTEIEQKSRKDIRAIYLKNGMDFIHCPIEDYTAPSVEALAPLVRQIVERLRGGESIVVHCNAGVGRTGVVLAATLSALERKEPGQMLDRLSELMTIEVTDEQRRLVSRWWQECYRV